MEHVTPYLGISQEKQALPHKDTHTQFQSTLFVTSRLDITQTHTMSVQYQSGIKRKGCGECVWGSTDVQEADLGDDVKILVSVMAAT